MQVQRPSQPFTSGLIGAFGGPPKSQPSEAQAEVLKIARMTPAERMCASILSGMGLDEAAVQAMDPKDREAIEEKVKEKIREMIEASSNVKGAAETTGILLDIQI